MFEEALAMTEANAEATLRAATATVNSLKKFRVAVQTGNLRELRRAIEISEKAIETLRMQFTNAKKGWNFDEEAYLSSKDFPLEIIVAAEKLGLKIFEQDDRLYCYPFLMRILPNERAVLIDKTRYRRLRPSVIGNHLKRLQDKPVRFNFRAFLESLYSAYSTAIKTRGRDRLGSGTIIPFMEIYGLLTLLPGQSKEYSKQEFARDIYYSEHLID